MVVVWALEACEVLDYKTCIGGDLEDCIALDGPYLDGLGKRQKELFVHG